MKIRCANCGRRIVWFKGDDVWPEGWQHKKSNLRHCDYLDTLATPGKAN